MGFLRLDYLEWQAIVEHPFGIIKRQCGFYYIMTKKGINRAAVDVGLIFIDKIKIRKDLAF